jgi:hypothetical protein
MREGRGGRRGWREKLRRRARAVGVQIGVMAVQPGFKGPVESRNMGDSG